ncbi:hypothetical protein Tco_1137651 [Tanacetum coccineum]
MYKIKHKKVRADLEEVFTDHKIVEVVRVTTKKQYGLDFMEQIIVIRENDKPNSFSKADFKYLNKMILKIYEQSVGLIYLNNKEEESIIDLVDIPKFCDGTLEKVLKEVKLKIFETEFKMKTVTSENFRNFE